jgi:biopolymer transport protein ExbD
MSRRKPPAVKEDISPNLIPMIDIMFLLLLFFMLGADMAKREFAEVVLPTANNAQEDDGRRGEVGVTIINIHHNPRVTCAVHDNDGVCREKEHWLWDIRGKAYSLEEMKKQIQLEADSELEDAPDPVAKKVLSKRKVLIRAARTAPYGDVQKVIEVCGTAGIYKIEVGAARPAPTAQG